MVVLVFEFIYFEFKFSFLYFFVFCCVLRFILYILIYLGYMIFDILEKIISIL